MQCDARPAGPAVIIHQRRVLLPKIILETFDPGLGESGWTRIHELVEASKTPSQRPLKRELGALIQKLVEKGNAPIEFRTLGVETKDAGDAQI